MQLALTVVPLGMMASGIATAVLAGAVAVLFSGAPLPDFETLPPRAAHGVGARVLLALIALHIGAALWHPLRCARPFARMGWG